MEQGARRELLPVERELREGAGAEAMEWVGR